MVGRLIVDFIYINEMSYDYVKLIQYAWVEFLYT